MDLLNIHTNRTFFIIFATSTKKLQFTTKKKKKMGLKSPCVTMLLLLMSLIECICQPKGTFRQ